MCQRPTDKTREFWSSTVRSRHFSELGPEESHNDATLLRCAMLQGSKEERTERGKGQRQPLEKSWPLVFFPQFSFLPIPSGAVLALGLIKKGIRPTIPIFKIKCSNPGIPVYKSSKELILASIEPLESRKKPSYFHPRPPPDKLRFRGFTHNKWDLGKLTFQINFLN